jgi:hypothetical protein
MAVYTTPNEVHEHYVERDAAAGTGAGIWAVIAVLIVLFALLFFGSNIFRSGGTGGSTNNNTDNGSIQGEVQTPGGSGSGSINY